MIEMRHKDELVGFYPDMAAARQALLHMPFPMQDLTLAPTKRFEFRVNGQLAATFDDKQAAELGAQAWLERFNARAREFGSSPMSLEHTELVDTGEREPAAPPSAALDPMIERETITQRDIGPLPPMGQGAVQPPATSSPAAPPQVPSGQVIPTAEDRPATGGAAMAPAGGAAPMHAPHPPLNVGPVPTPTAVVAPSSSQQAAPTSLIPPLPGPAMYGVRAILTPLDRAKEKVRVAREEFQRALDVYDRALGELASEHAKPAQPRL
jgi:hypothetical protein